MTKNEGILNAQLKQTPEMIANRKYVLSQCKPDGVPMNLDLSDDRHFNFLLDERGGNEYLKNHFPYYHQLLHNSRQNAIKGKKNLKTSFAPAHLTLLEKMANGDDVSTDWHDLVQVTDLVAQRIGSSDDHGVHATALVSFVDGLQSMNAMLTIGNPDTGEIIAQTNIPQLYDQGYDTVITAHGTTKKLDGVEASLSIDYVLYNTKDIVHKVLKIPLLDKIDPSEPIRVTDPVHKHGVNNVGFMKVCMGRYGADCDYEYEAQPQPSPPIPTIAVSGSVTYAGTISQPGPDSGKFGIYFFVKKRDGGAAQLFTKESEAYKYFKLSNNNHTLSWNFPPATFEKAPWDQGNEVDLNLTANICVDSQVKNTCFQVTSLKGIDGNPSIAKIDVLKFFWGCLSADSLILMKDGSKKRVDSIKVSDRVQIDDSGSYLSVVDIVTGKEEKPCLRVTTENNRSLLVTDEHPIFKFDGFCLVKELRIGDFVKTESGFERVSNVSEELYNGTIYNLKLGGHENQEQAGAAHYANGIFVGDGNMQGFLLEKRKAEAMKPRSIEELPEEWRFDAENARRLREGEVLISV
ncbi:MAG: hypothetical protein FIB08_04520 [Candidatus Methanoperedens sp.]|nr:hypothetical protein [Candidatus Methanoperedens sp.]